MNDVNFEIFATDLPLSNAENRQMGLIRYNGSYFAYWAHDDLLCVRDTHTDEHWRADEKLLDYMIEYRNASRDPVAVATIIRDLSDADLKGIANCVQSELARRDVVSPLTNENYQRGWMRELFSQAYHRKDMEVGQQTKAELIAALDAKLKKQCPTIKMRNLSEFTDEDWAAMRERRAKRRAEIAARDKAEAEL